MQKQAQKAQEKASKRGQTQFDKDLEERKREADLAISAQQGGGGGGGFFDSLPKWWPLAAAAAGVSLLALFGRD